MNKELWKSIEGLVDIKKYPKLPCPYCGEVALCFEQKGMLIKPVSENLKKMAKRHLKKQEERKAEEFTKEIALKSDFVVGMWKKHPLLGILGGVGVIVHESSKPNVTVGQFTAYMQCATCHDYVAVSGCCEDINGGSASKEIAQVKVKVEYFSLPIPLFEINEAVPYSIEKELLNAFSYYHFDPCASANQLRRAIERFCSELGANGKTLHQQIEKLKSKYPQEARYLVTLRLVGNEGTHADGVDENDLLDAFEIFHKVLDVFPRNLELEKLEKGTKALERKFGKKINQENETERT